MARTPRQQRKWLVLFPIFLRHEPKNSQEIVAKAADYGFSDNDNYSGLYTTEADAWTAAKDHLERAKNQAQSAIAFLTKLSDRPDGPMKDRTNLAKWTAEAREELRIADRGLSLCRQV